jgi:hypothetical protein
MTSRPVRVVVEVRIEGLSGVEPAFVGSERVLERSMLFSQVHHELVPEDRPLDRVAQERDELGVGHDAHRACRYERMKQVVRAHFAGQRSHTDPPRDRFAMNARRELGAVPTTAVRPPDVEEMHLGCDGSTHGRVLAQGAVQM